MKKYILIFFVCIQTVVAQNPVVTSAEYFWGTTDPGVGNGTALTAEDTQFNERVESIIASQVNSFTTQGPILFNIRVKDGNNQWGPTFKKVVFVNDNTFTTRQIKLTKFEYFFGNFDPGEGNGTTIVAFDGALDEAVETVFRTQATWAMATGPVLFNIRARDVNNLWGPLFRKTVFPFGANPNAQLIAEGDSIEICQGSSVTLTYSGPNGYTPTWFDGSQGNTITFTPTQAGSVTVTATLENSTYTDAINIIFKPQPTSTITPSGQVLVCASSNFLLQANTGTGLSYQWFLNGNAITNATTPTHLPTAVGSYTVRVTDATTTCSKISDPTVLATNFAAQPNGILNFCDSQVLALSVPFGSLNTYQWRKDNVNINGANTNTYTATEPGVYSCFITNGSCTFTTSNITAIPNIAPSFVQVNPICAGTPLSELPTTSTNGISGTWSPALNNTATTTYTFTPNAGQCATATTMTITVTPNIAPSFVQVNPICAGTTLTALPTTSTNGISGTWSPALNNTATTTYTFTPNAGQCATSSTTTMTITVTPNIAPSFVQVNPICNGTTLTELPTTSTNGISGTWSPALNNTATTTYTFTPNAGQCATSSTTTMTITVTPNTAPSFVQVNPICNGTTLTELPTTSTNGISGTWSPGLNNTATTTYTFTPSTGQCATTTTMTVTVTPNIAPSFVQVNPICAGTTLTALPTTSTNGVSGTWSPALNNTATTTYTFTPSTGQCATTTTMTVTVTPNIAPSFVQVNQICAGTVLTALPTTSINGVSGTWSPALNNTATTTYTFTPSTGQCATSTTMTITVTPNIAPSFVQVNPICAGTTLTELPTTSTNGISGTWSPALNNTATTTYTFTPNAGQCASATTMTVSVTPNIAPSFVQVNPICAGTTLTELPTTSTNGISGTWSPALNNTATTTYTFTPNAGQCASATTMTVSVTPNIAPSFVQVNPICAGTTLTSLPTTSTNGFSGTWSPALNNTATTTYTFTPNAGQCASATTMTVTINTNISPTPIASSSQSFNDGDTLANLIVTGTNLQWYSSSSGGTTLPLSTILVSGTTYYVSQQAEGDCESERISITVTLNLSNDDFVSKWFSLYPNPTKSILNFKSAVEINKIIIYNMLGQLVQEEQVNGFEGSINIERLAQGTYSVKVNDLPKGYTVIKN